MKALFYCLVTFILISIFEINNTYAWDGSDSESGASVEIGEGNLVREGETIEIYEYNTGEYKDVEVVSIEANGSTVDIEVYDSETGEYRTIEMEN